MSRRGEESEIVHLELVPLDDNDLLRFVTHWYTTQEPTDRLARERGITDLMATFGSETHVRELARNPMLAMLIALIHRYEVHLPGARALLYDVCVKTLIETWPEARDRTFAKIDPRLQRTYLETLACRMQQPRSEHVTVASDAVIDPLVESHRRWNVTIAHDVLVDRLVEILLEDEGSSAPEEIRSRVEQWVRFLNEGSGMLVERYPGVFEFIHLSLMEYLAARGLDRVGIAEDAIEEHFRSYVWREVCLLAVGSKAKEKPFLDRLFDRLREKTGAWPFLLRCLREEARFDERQRARADERELFGSDPCFASVVKDLPDPLDSGMFRKQANGFSGSATGRRVKIFVEERQNLVDDGVGIRCLNRRGSVFAGYRCSSRSQGS